jgi:hypothetical protein
VSHPHGCHGLPLWVGGPHGIRHATFDMRSSAERTAQSGRGTMQRVPVGMQRDALPRHAGSQAVRIEFTLTRCELFAFWLSERAT